MEEIYKDIPGYNNYKISNKGNVKNVKFKKHRILIPQLDRYGYRVVHLRENGNKLIKIHRLVAISFVTGYVSGLTVNHKDGNKYNNCPSNLEWISASDNTKHSHRTGLARYAYGEKAGSCKLTIDDVRLIKLLNGSMPQHLLGRIFGIKQTEISRIIRGERWAYLSIK